MSMNDNATLVVSGGYYYTAEVGTPAPANPLEPGEAWTPIGHTSMDEIMSFSSEGGEQTVLGTLQNRNLRTRYAPRTESFGLNLQQFDKESLKLYYGSNAEELPDGSLAVPADPKPTTRAFLAVFVDGDYAFWLHAEKADIFRGDDIDLADTENLNSLPLQVTPLNNGTNKHAYSVMPITKVRDTEEEGEEGEEDEEDIGG